MGERLARRSPEAIRSLKRAVYEGASLPLAQGLGVERKWFMVASATDSSQEKMAAMARQVEEEGRSPWASAEGLVPWQDGSAADESRPAAVGPLRDPADHGPDDARRLRKLSRLEAVDPEARVGDQLAGWAVGMTPRREPPPRALEPVLPAGGPGTTAAHVLEEEELSSLDEDAAGLREGTLRVGTVQSTSVATTVSKLSSSNGRSSAEASTTLGWPGAPGSRATRSRRRLAMWGSGSVRTSSVTAPV